MDKARQWFNEAVENRQKVFATSDSDFIIYKGFKITKSIDGNYEIQDVRMNDFYSKVMEKDFIILTNLGFIKGADKISYERNLRRVAIYTKKLEKLYTEREMCKKKLPTNVKFYEKKLKNCQENIGKYIDLMFFYKSQVVQYEQVKN